MEAAVAVQRDRAVRRAGDDRRSQSAVLQIRIVREHRDVERRALRGRRRVGVGNRCVVHRGDGNGDRRDRGLVGAVAHTVRERIRSVVVAGRRVGEGLVRIQHDRAMRRTGHEDWRQRVVFSIRVVREHGDGDRRVLVRRCSVVLRNRSCIRVSRHGDGYRGDVGRQLAVAHSIRERIRAHVVCGRHIRERAVRVQRHRAASRPGFHSRSERIVLRIGVVGENVDVHASVLRRGSCVVHRRGRSVLTRDDTNVVEGDVTARSAEAQQVEEELYGCARRDPREIDRHGNRIGRRQQASTGRRQTRHSDGAGPIGRAVRLKVEQAVGEDQRDMSGNRGIPVTASSSATSNASGGAPTPFARNCAFRMVKLSERASAGSRKACEMPDIERSFSLNTRAPFETLALPTAFHPKPAEPSTMLKLPLSIPAVSEPTLTSPCGGHEPLRARRCPDWLP